MSPLPDPLPQPLILPRKGGGGHGGGGHGGGKSGGSKGSGGGGKSTSTRPSSSLDILLTVPQGISISGGSGRKASTGSKGGGKKFKIASGAFAGREAGGGTRVSRAPSSRLCRCLIRPKEHCLQRQLLRLRLPLWRHGWLVYRPETVPLRLLASLYLPFIRL